MRTRGYIIITAAAMIGYMALEYIVRGYFAIGAEILFPVVAVGAAAVLAE